MQDRVSVYLSSNAKKFVRGIGRNQVSANTRRALNQGNFDFLGSVRRHTEYKDKLVYNVLFEKYLDSVGLSKPIGYMYANANTDAELKSVKKYDKTQPLPDKEAMEISYNWMVRHFNQYMSGSHCVSKEVALENLDKTTSPGYPWTLMFGSKNDMVAKMDIGPFLDDYWIDLTSGQPPEMGTFWTDSVKAEMRPLAKYEANELRTFCASPIEHSVSLNRVCLDMNNRFYEAGSKNVFWSKVGISKFNLGWNRLGRKLSKHKQGFALDMSQYDSSVFVEMLIGVMNARKEFLRGTNADMEALEKLYNSIINSIMVLCNGDVVQKTTGIPSGSANTVVDNTMILQRVLCYCYIRACMELPEMLRKKYLKYEIMMQHVEAALYGDDNTLMISDEIISWFNARVIAKFADELGMKVTAENDMWDPQPLENLTFLSHGFKMQEKLWVPVPDYDKMLCSLLYGSRQDDPRWHLMRGYALRIECFFNERAFDVIEGYIGYVLQTQKKYLTHGEIAKGVTMEQVQGMFRSVNEIKNLYLSQETKVCLLKGSDNQALLPLIDFEFNYTDAKTKQ